MEEFSVLVKNELELYIIQKKLFSLGLVWTHNKDKYHTWKTLMTAFNASYIGTNKSGNKIRISAEPRNVITWKELNAINPD
jgi:hypothetical protein